ncbi:MAG: chromate transporter [Chloroflexi bacterium]|nr:chromate transporter [Chloroflexota bacterium]
MDTESEPIGLVDLFRIFLLGGLTFGGGLAIITVLERELISKRRAIARQDFLTYYALARVVPTGTQTALAVSLGNHFAGFRGSVVAVAGLLTPVFVATVALTALFTYGVASGARELLPKTVLPAALALIVVGAVSMGRDLFGLKRETLLATTGFLAALLLHVPPGLVLVLGGVAGIFLFRGEARKEAKK